MAIDINCVNCIIAVINLFQQVLLVYAALKGLEIFKNYRKQQKSEAAWKLLALIEGTITNIKEIALNPVLYVTSHIDENHMYSLKKPTSEELEKFDARPSRLIYNMATRLRRDSIGLLAQLAGNEAKELKKLIDESIKYFNFLGNAIGEKIKNSHFLEADKIRNVLDNYPVDLENFLDEAKKILNPIIDK